MSPVSRIKPVAWVRRWTALVGPLALALLALVGLALMGLDPDVESPVHQFGGLALLAGSMGVAVIVGVRLLMLLLTNRFAVTSVAQTVLREALRMKLVVLFVVLTILIIAALPFVISVEDPLQYRIQSFLSYSIGMTGVLLSLMTIFLACATLSSEIEQKQIFTVMTKPVNRGQYLLGKWLGIVLLDVLLIAAAGGAIYSVAVGYLAPQPAKDQLDRIAVDEQVLTARVAADPIPPEGFADEIERRVQRRIERTQEAGEPVTEAVRRAIRAEVEKQIFLEWRSVPPQFSGRVNQHDYVFPGMQQARSFDRSIQLSYTIQASDMVPNAQTRIGWLVNGRRLTPARQVPVNIRQVELIPVDVIPEDGRLVVSAVNFNPRVSISFPAEDGLQLLYRVDTFGPNLARGLAMMLVKLAFLAALGLAAATFLGFPVAVVLSLLIFAGASASQFILQALEFYGNPNPHHSDFVLLVSRILKSISYAFTIPLHQYSEFRPTPLIVEGRYIGWGGLARCLGWIGGVWCLVTGVIGWLIFRNRELARVQV